MILARFQKGPRINQKHVGFCNISLNKSLTVEYIYMDILCIKVLFIKIISDFPLESLKEQ